MNDIQPIREEDALNLDEMAAYSRKTSFVRLCRGDTEGAAFWRGRARGLELAAINLRLPPLEPEAPPTSIDGETRHG